MKRIAIALLLSLVAAAPIAYATRVVPGHTEQNILLRDVWLVNIARASFQDVGDPPPAPRLGFVVIYSYAIRDAAGDVRRQGEYRKELTGNALTRMQTLVNGDLAEINADAGL